MHAALTATTSEAYAVTADELATLWTRISEHLKSILGEAVHRSWIRPIGCLGLDGGRLLLAVPTRFMREWVNVHYMADIQRLAQSMRTDVLGVELLVRNAAEPALTPPPAAAGAAEPEAPMDAAMSAALDPRFTFENFVVGKPNELAHAAARRVAESTQVVAGCNPLFLYGGVGLGKTHLMHAIAWHIRTHNPTRKVIYLSAEKFMYQFIRALRQKEAYAFKETFRSVDVLMIDDVQFIAGKESTQEEFFHTFNALVDQHKQLIISADRSPSDLEGMEERIRSRLGWGLVADIHATTYELRLGILQSKVEQLKADVPARVLEFLAQRISSNVRELEGALNRVVAHATLIGRPITMESAQDVLSDLLRANDRRLTIEDIQRKVAEHFTIKVSDMHSARRSRSVARPRQVAMYLSKKHTTKSLPEIGRRFGGKDHTTVIHAVKKVEELMSLDAEFAAEVERLSRSLAA